MDAAMITNDGYISNFCEVEFPRRWLSIDGNVARMSKLDTRKILATNLRSLMARTPSLDTQVKVARKAGIAQSTVGRFLKGDVYAQLSQLEALASAFRVEVADLLTHEGTSQQNRHEAIEGYDQLREEEKKEVADFIAFLAARYSANDNTDTTAIDETTESPAGLKERLLLAIQRELNNDTLNLANESTTETKSTNRGKRSNSR